MEFLPKYNTGNAQIDAEHREIFLLVRSVIESTKGNLGASVGDAIEFLANYTLNHFKTEENIMELSDYPHYEAHKKQHDDFVIEVVDLRTRVIHETDRKAASTDIKNVIEEWIDTHILTSDMQLAAHYQQWINER